MIHLRPRLVGIYLASLTLLFSALIVSSPASAAAVDLSFAWKPGEDSACRQWQPNQTASWNFTLAMNGTDSSSITTPTYVWINDSGAPAMQNDGWIAILAASGNISANPPSYDVANSNDFATGNNVYAPSTNSLDLYLYSEAHGAPATNVTLLVTGFPDSENKNHYFNISAQTHRQGAPDVTRTVSLCVHIPPRPRFSMGAREDLIQTVPDTTVSVYFWVKNIGNTPDYYFCNATVPQNNWTWRFGAGMNQAGGQNFTNLRNVSENLTIRVDVTIPAGARAHENSTVAVNCTSYKGMLMGMSYFGYYPQTRIEVLQFFFIAARIPADSPSILTALPGDTLRCNFTITNAGNGPDVGLARIVSATFSGSDSWPTSLTASNFPLAAYGDPGDKQAAQLVVSIPQGTPMGTYPFRVNATSATNGTYVTTLTCWIQVNQFYRPLVSPVPPQVGAAGQELVFNFTITNGGNGLDSLRIQVLNLSGWSVFLSPPQGKKLLEAGAAFTFQATVIVPATLQPGTYGQRVLVTSEYAQLDLGLTVFDETNLTVIFQPKNACSFTPPDAALEANPRVFPGSVVETKPTFALFNLGRGTDVFTLSAAASAALTVTLEPPHPSLGFLANVSILVTVRTWPLAAQGAYEATITARSDADANVFCSATIQLQIRYPPGLPLPDVLNLSINGIRTTELTADTPALFEVDLAHPSNYTVTWRFDGGIEIFPDAPTLAHSAGPHHITVLVDNGSAWREYAFEVVALRLSPSLPPTVNLTVNGSSNVPPVEAGEPISVSLDLANPSDYKVSWFVDETPAGTGPEVSLTLSAGTHNVTAVVSNATDSRSYSFDIVAREIPTTASGGASFLPAALLLAVAGGAAAVVLTRRRRGSP